MASAPFFCVMAGSTLLFMGPEVTLTLGFLGLITLATWRARRYRLSRFELIEEPPEARPRNDFSGDREPRVPRPSAGAGAAALPLPGDTLLDDVG